MRLPVYSSVQPKAEDHPRAGQTGSTRVPDDWQASDHPLADDETGVLWADGETTREKCADLKVL